jgi:hypothetical protein
LDSVCKVAEKFWLFVKTLNLRRDKLGRDTFDTYVLMEKNPTILKHITRRYPSR